MKFSELRAKVSSLSGQLKAILEKAHSEDRELSAEETANYERLKAQFSPLKARFDRQVEVHAIQIESDASGTGRIGGDFASLGEFMHAVRFNPRDRRLGYVENDGVLRAEMRTDDGPSGGFAIPRQFLPTLMAIKPQSAIIRPRAQVIPAGNPPDAAITIPAVDQTGPAPSNVFGGVQVGWIGEGGVKPNTDMRLREVTLTPHEVAGLIIVTDKLLRNWRSASSVLEQQLSGAISQAEDLAFLAGNGIAKPLGFLRSTALYRVSRQVIHDAVQPSLAHHQAGGDDRLFRCRATDDVEVVAGAPEGGVAILGAVRCAVAATAGRAVPVHRLAPGAPRHDVHRLAGLRRDDECGEDGRAICRGWLRESGTG